VSDGNAQIPWYRSSSGRRRRGRPTKLTPALQEEFQALLREGHHAGTACAFLRVSQSAYYEWLRRGQESDEEPYAQFAENVCAAEAEAEMDAWAVVAAEARRNPDMALKLLKARWPRRYGVTIEERTLHPSPSIDPTSAVPATPEIRARLTEVLNLIGEEHYRRQREGS